MPSGRIVIALGSVVSLALAVLVHLFFEDDHVPFILPIALVPVGIGLFLSRYSPDSKRDIPGILGLMKRIRLEDPARPVGAALDEILPALRRVLAFEGALLVVLDRLSRVEVREWGDLTEPGQKIKSRASAVIRLMQRTQAPDGRLDIVITRLNARSFTGRPHNLQARYKNMLRWFYRNLREWGKAGFELLIPLRHGTETVGFLALSEKGRSRSYTHGEMEFVSAFSYVLATSLASRMNSDELRDMRSRAEKITRFFSNRDTDIRRPLAEDRTIIYRSALMHGIMEKVNQAAASTRPVLITGETGTGKELFARLMHETERYRGEPFVAVNCAAIPSTLWEDEIFGHVKGAFTDAQSGRDGRVTEAGRGILFFDEIGEMPLEMQAKMLRLLQEGEFNRIGSGVVEKAQCRFVFATNQNMDDMVIRDQFRLDLYYRISVFQIDLPPLRQRKEDIPGIVEHFVRQYAEELGIGVTTVSAEAMDALSRYRWPGNVRELENVIIRSIAACTTEVLALTDLPVAVREARGSTPMTTLPAGSDPDAVHGNYEELVESYARELIVKALRRARGNKSRAAAILGIKRGRLLYQIKELGIEE